MRITKIIVSVLLVVCGVLSLSACTSKSSFVTDDVTWEANKICATVWKAFYGEKSDDGEIVSDSGENGFTAIVAITNSTNCSKNITTVNINYIYDEQGRAIVENGVFNLEEDLYLEAGGRVDVQCDFTEDEVLLRSGLKSITSEIALDYEGCIYNGKEPGGGADDFSVSITEALFTDTGSIEGDIAIRNNYSTAMSPTKLTFTLTTDSGDDVTISPVTIDISATIQPGEVLSVPYAIANTNIYEDIKVYRNFNTFNVDFTIK